jgi:toxin YoeB
MVNYKLIFTQQAQKDAIKIKNAGLQENLLELLELLKNNPYQNPPSYEKLVGDLSGAYSRRINVKHRLVYQILEEQRIVKILRMWTHYE